MNREIDIKQETTKKYTPIEIEKTWYKYWEDNGYFKPEINQNNQNKNNYIEHLN